MGTLRSRLIHFWWCFRRGITGIIWESLGGINDSRWGISSSWLPDASRWLFKDSSNPHQTLIKLGNVFRPLKSLKTITNLLQMHSLALSSHAQTIQNNYVSLANALNVCSYGLSHCTPTSPNTCVSLAITPTLLWSKPYHSDPAKHLHFTCRWRLCQWCNTCTQKVPRTITFLLRTRLA